MPEEVPNGERNNIAPIKRSGFAKGNQWAFKKGDPRCWRKGRPRTFDQCRAIAQELAHEKIKGDSAITELLRSWRDSNEPMLQLKFVEYAFGKVPDKLETTGLENKPVLILHYSHERKAEEQNAQN
jgi:hypothetical protein